MPLEIIQKFVAARGVNFVSTKENQQAVLAAGGNVALVGTINLNRKDELSVPLTGDKDKEEIGPPPLVSWMFICARGG